MGHGKQSHSMTTAAMILSIIALTTTATVYLPIVCGSLGMMFALLSKGGSMSMSSSSRIAFILSAISVALAVVLGISVTAYVLITYGSFSHFLEMYSSYYSELTGQLSF